MKYILLLAFLLLGCEHTPGQFKGSIQRMFYWSMNDRNTTIEIYSDKYGKVNVDDSPYFESLKIGDEVTVACDDLKGVFGRPVACYVVSKSVSKDIPNCNYKSDKEAAFHIFKHVKLDNGKDVWYDDTKKCIDGKY